MHEREKNEEVKLEEGHEEACDREREQRGGRARSARQATSQVIIQIAQEKTIPTLIHSSYINKKVSTPLTSQIEIKAT